MPDNNPSPEDQMIAFGLVCFLILVSLCSMCIGGCIGRLTSGW